MTLWAKPGDDEPAPQAGQFLGAMVFREGSAVQRYAGLLMSLRTRPVPGVNVNTNYTWSHCVGDPFYGLEPPGYFDKPKFCISSCGKNIMDGAFATSARGVKFQCCFRIELIVRAKVENGRQVFVAG